MGEKLCFEVHGSEDVNAHRLEGYPVGVQCDSMLNLRAVTVEPLAKTRFGVGLSNINQLVIEKELIDALRVGAVRQEIGPKRGCFHFIEPGYRPG